MDKILSDTLAVYRPEAQSKQEAGAIILNGYHIDAAELIMERGKLRSFRIVRGNFYDDWAQQTPLHLRTEQGQLVDIKIVAYPTDAESFGLVQFL